MTLISKSFCAAAVALSCMGVAGPSAASDPNISEQAKHKINLAGRQRMLTQRMAKSVCFASKGVYVERHIKILSETSELFDATLTGLRNGDEELGLTPETAPSVLAELSRKDALWYDYIKVVREALADNDKMEQALQTIAALNMPALDQANRVVLALEEHYGGKDESAYQMAHAVNIAGRQRMLSQKASKEFCLALVGVNPEQNRAALAQTIALFDESLDGLIDGSEEMDLIPAPSPEIRSQLELIRSYWGPMKLVFERAANGERPSLVHIKRAAIDTSTVLFEMNRAVLMYERL